MKRTSNTSGGKTSEGAHSRGSAPAGKPQPSGECSDLAPGLYVVATPIGHAKDISLRALEILSSVDRILAEDTRVTAKLLAIHGIARPLGTYNDHNAGEERPRILRQLQGGARLALVSDAGTPLVSDPGFKLVRAAVEEGIAVHAIPGASAALTALTLSALPSDRFFFAGFLPAKAGERASALAELKALRASLIFFESPQRLAESLAAMAEAWGDRPAAVARELTKLHEELRRGRLPELAGYFAKHGPPKGEVTVVVGPPHEAEADFAAIDRALDQALSFMPLKAASEMIAGLTGASRKEIYARGLAKKDG